MACNQLKDFGNSTLMVLPMVAVLVPIWAILTCPASAFYKGAKQSHKLVIFLKTHKIENFQFQWSRLCSSSEMLRHWSYKAGWGTTLIRIKDDIILLVL